MGGWWRWCGLIGRMRSARGRGWLWRRTGGGRGRKDDVEEGVVALWDAERFFFLVWAGPAAYVDTKLPMYVHTE